MLSTPSSTPLLGDLLPASRWPELPAILCERPDDPCSPLTIARKADELWKLAIALAEADATVSIWAKLAKIKSSAAPTK